jgi:tRNA A-37 threonylcarbamoyl transferase component Bud32
VEELFQEARDIREEVSENKETYEEMESEIGKARRKLERAEDRIENAPETVLDRVDETAGGLDQLRRNAEDYGYFQEEVEDLEKRCERLRQRAEKEVQPSKEEGPRPPETVPRAPELSVEYTELGEKEAVGSGGNADVYRTSYGGETIAVKEPRMSGTLHTETVERMMKEAETWDRLDDNDHIVGVIDYDSEPLPWIAMEYMDAGHLGERAGEMEFEQAVWTAVCVTKAVRHAHRRGVAHLDLKPENVLFRRTDDDHYDAPKVADWGLSKHLLDHSKSVEGLSPQYSAPEQFDDDYGSADDITDVYQLGAVFYELFTGKPPFEGQPAKVMNKVMNEEPTPPSEVADVPSEIDDILLTAMARDKKERYETVVNLRNDLQGIL